MSVPVVEIENLVKRYQELVALDHFNLTIEEGEIFGLLGQPSTASLHCLPLTREPSGSSVRKCGRTATI